MDRGFASSTPSLVGYYLIIISKRFFAQVAKWEAKEETKGETRRNEETKGEYYNHGYWVY